MKPILIKSNLMQKARAKYQSKDALELVFEQNLPKAVTKRDIALSTQWIFGLVCICLLYACGPMHCAECLSKTHALNSSLPVLFNLAATTSYSTSLEKVNMIKKQMADIQKANKQAKNHRDQLKAWENLETEHLNPFLAKWQEKGTLSRGEVNESVQIVSAKLKAICAMEKNKN